MKRDAKAEKKKQKDKDHASKRQRKSAPINQEYVLASVTYSNADKVKSKARAIINTKKDGDRVEGKELEFIRELLKFHSRYEEKTKDFSHLEVDTHPSYENTRCYFIVHKDGSKEDFSISKCIANMEEHYE